MRYNPLYGVLVKCYNQEEQGRKNAGWKKRLKTRKKMSSETKFEKTEYRALKAEEIDRSLFQHFIRRQIVTKCWRKVGGEWIIKDAPFIDDWGEAEYGILVACLKNTVNTGGVVYGAFEGGLLKGFVSVESALFGRRQEYLDLTSIHVSEDRRGSGIGKELFTRAAGWAKMHGGKKLYISSHSAVESQAFYRAVGCVEAAEYNREHVEREPYDCQLEYVLF